LQVEKSSSDLVRLPEFDTTTKCLMSSLSRTASKAGILEPRAACPEKLERSTVRGMTTHIHGFRQLGSAGPTVFPLALGCMGMSGMYGPSEEGESIATIHAALDAGITLLDTGDYYGAGHNELLIGRALRDRRDTALVSVKFGALRGPDGSWLGM